MSPDVVPNLQLHPAEIEAQACSDQVAVGPVSEFEMYAGIGDVVVFVIVVQVQTTRNNVRCAMWAH